MRAGGWWCGAFIFILMACTLSKVVFNTFERLLKNSTAPSTAPRLVASRLQTFLHFGFY